MDSEQQNLAFQLAIYTKIGFGAPKNNTQAFQLLSQCQKTSEELEGALKKLNIIDDPRITNNLTTWHILRNARYVQLINLAKQYTQVDKISVAVEEFSKELSDIENTLGRNNNFWEFHAHTIVLSYYKLGYWNSKIHMLQQMLEMDKTATVAAMNLAQTYRVLGRYSKAETLQDRTIAQLLE
jgi:tetratricopeptide (TPR) repeat protein